nr:adenylyl-sulfate kinase [Chitinivorax tropicus]
MNDPWLSQARPDAQGRVLWLTGLSGAGKTSVANALTRTLAERRISSTVLDGDLIRARLNRDLGFSAADRTENIRRIAEVARLMANAGLVVVVATISPFARDRQLAKALIHPCRFHEIYINTPLSVCEQRDVKGLYARARGGEIAHFTGIDSPYEPPAAPDLTVDCGDLPIMQAVQVLIDFLLLPDVG